MATTIQDRSNSNNCTLPAIPRTEPMRTVSFVFGIVLSLPLCVVGIVGNMVSVAVLIKVIRHSGGRCPLFGILLALAVSDGLLLALHLLLNVLATISPFTGAPEAAALYLNHGRLIVTAWPIMMACQMSSILLTVLVSYERWIAVCQPLRAAKRVAQTRIVRLILLVGLVSLVYNAPRWWEYDVVECDLDPQVALMMPPCTQPPAQMEACPPLRGLSNVKSELGNNAYYRYMYAAGLYAGVMFVLPLIAITKLNVGLVRTMRSSRRKWAEISRSQRREVRLTHAPLAIVGLFYLLGMPAVGSNLMDSVMSGTNSSFGSAMGKDAQEAYVTVSNFCVVLNSASNFIIYCLLGEKFRTTLARMCGCRKAGFGPGGSRSHTIMLGVGGGGGGGSQQMSYRQHMRVNETSTTAQDRGESPRLLVAAMESPATNSAADEDHHPRGGNRWRKRELHFRPARHDK